MTDSYDDRGQEPYYDGCYKCGGAAFVVVCPDDMCRGVGYCQHEDGNKSCDVCNKDGTEEWNI